MCSLKFLIVIFVSLCPSSLIFEGPKVMRLVKKKPSSSFQTFSGSLFWFEYCKIDLNTEKILSIDYYRYFKKQ